MKKQSVISGIFLALLVSYVAVGQEYKLAKSTGRLEIREVNNVTIEGYSGNEIVFTSLDGSRDKDDRAQGLRAVSAMGLEDNTGIGLSVVDKGTTFEVTQLKKMDGPRVKILVPKGVTVSYRHTSPHGSDIKVRNVESELDISTVHNGVKLENVTGPLNIRTVHGEIEADLSATVKGPISLLSQHGFVDITLPSTLKATLDLTTSWGEIFLDPGLNIEIPKDGDWVKYGSNKVRGKMNGGGLEFVLGSNHGNVYVRKK
jgi:predicted membrane protein